MINVYELWSRYLFNQNQAPIGDALLDDKYIRDKNAIGDAVTIKASEFNASYGQFCLVPPLAKYTSQVECQTGLSYV